MSHVSQVSIIVCMIKNQTCWDFSWKSISFIIFHISQSMIPIKNLLRIVKNTPVTQAIPSWFFRPPPWEDPKIARRKSFGSGFGTRLKCHRKWSQKKNDRNQWLQWLSISWFWSELICCGILVKNCNFWGLEVEEGVMSKSHVAGWDLQVPKILDHCSVVMHSR